MKVLGVDKNMGKFLISEPNDCDDVKPGIVEFNEYTEKFEVKDSKYFWIFGALYSYVLTFLV